MARLQVLYLPSDSDGERIDARYALVADQAEALPENDREALHAFASQAGAQGCLIVSGVLDLDQGEEADDEAVEAVGEMLQALKVPAIAQPATAPQAPKLPPADTTEGKLARVWGGRKPTDEGDPQP